MFYFVVTFCERISFSDVCRDKARRPFLLCTPAKRHLADQLSAIIKEASLEVAGTFAHATAHTPTSVTEQATAFLGPVSADCVVSIGGGSVVRLGKAISIHSGVPHIIKHKIVKTTQSNSNILPALIIYDLDLTLTLPPVICSTSGINAIAHAVEALYAQNTNPITSILALEGIKSLTEALPQIVENPDSNAPRDQALYGAWLCGTVLGTSSMGLHHKICHTLGGSFGLPHAETHTVMLPYSFSSNAPYIPEQMAKLAAVLPRSDGDAERIEATSGETASAAWTERLGNERK
ncbi:ADH4-alcohol dehydrogenase IV [Fusarium pseudoanthophilum]|uniref:ADH4-alcohol dehydrogenase IV n=1 Tax=Fusarium pseudoanthophilum TaxID=48495 RepID=A0A8H5Q4U0_9HYPO|nr:ADH4-alcohol dehydrogenase IV [Fusarium pseudoanthophilum]